MTLKNQLPPEIWYSIASKLTDYHSVSQLSLVSKTLFRIAQERLFQLDAQSGHYWALEWAAVHGSLRLVYLSRELSFPASEPSPSRGSELLFSAVIWGQDDVVEGLLTLFHVDLELCDEHSRSILEVAILHGQLEVVKLLLRSGLSASQRSMSRFGRTPLHYAMDSVTAFDGTLIEIVEVLIDMGADIDALDNYGRTPLCLTVEQGKLSHTQLLLAHGAHVGFDVLHRAVSCGHMDVLYLLTCQFQNTLNDFVYAGYHLLHTAVTADQYRSARWLLDEGANPDVRVQDINSLQLNPDTGKTPLLLAMDSNNTDIAKLLLDHGADMELADNGGMTPVQLAMQKQGVNLLELLIKHGADINQPLRTGHLPITLAASMRKTRHAKLLVEKGANPNTRNLRGECAICISASVHNQEMILWLSDIGANVRRSNSDGQTALHCAANVETAGVDAAVAAGVMNIIEFLVSSRVGIDTRDKQGRTALHLLARKGDPASVQYLLDARARFNVTDNYGLSPLCYAVGHKYRNTKILIKHGADVSVVTRSGQRPTTLAAIMMVSNTMDLLFQEMRVKTMVAEPDTLGRTALFYAVMTGDFDTCQTAINQLPKKHVPLRDVYGTTPAMIAARNGHAGILQLLLDNIDCEQDVLDNEGLSLINWAARGGSHQVWDLLCSNLGAEANMAEFTAYQEDDPQHLVQFASNERHCTVCGRCAIHQPHATPKMCSLCKIGTKGFLACEYCIEKGIKCLDNTHIWDDDRRKT